AVLANRRREKREGRRGRRVEAAGPSLQDAVVVRQETPQPRGDDRVVVGGCRGAHRQRERRRGGLSSVGRVVVEPESAARKALERPRDDVVEDDDQGVDRDRNAHRARNRARWVSRSMGAPSTRSAASTGW